jgi:hypothetical protein
MSILQIMAGNPVQKNTLLGLQGGETFSGGIYFLIFGYVEFHHKYLKIVQVIPKNLFNTIRFHYERPEKENRG